MNGREARAGVRHFVFRSESLQGLRRDAGLRAIESDKVADLIVLSASVLTIPPERCRKTRMDPTGCGAKH